MSIDTLIKLSKTSQLSMEYILLGEEIQPDADLTAIEALLARCTPREVRLPARSSGCFCCGETHSGPAAAG